ncbi:MAG: hypothetical protein ACRDTF_06605 [Pseudonocardiaceae bacterium]
MTMQSDAYRIFSLGPRFIDDANLSRHWADTFVTLQRPVEATRFAHRSISAATSQNRGRRAALGHAALAQAALTRRDRRPPRRAQAVDLSTTVQSSRCIEAVRDLRTRISPYQTLSATRDFDDRAREVLATSSTNTTTS